MNHQFTSDACYHDDHNACENECAWCKAPCSCWCHRTVAGDQKTAEEPWT